MKRIDLHTHTTVSDGTATPRELMELAAEKGLAAVAVTDHDAVAGCAEAEKAGRELGIEVIPGIEISTKFNRAVHIVGLFIDTASPALTEVLDWIVSDRDRRNGQMAELMAADGLPVSYAEMKERFGTVVGRPHFARVLCELGLAADVNEAFALYVEKGKKYYVGRNFLSIDRSIEIIREAGGIPILAHPFQYKLDDAELRELIEVCLSFGLRGMECRYTGYTEEQTAYLSALCAEYGLLRSGGSDFHGRNKPSIALGSGRGELCVPYEYLEEMRSKA